MSNALYSSTAPAGWNQLPLETKEQFIRIASKGDWTAQEAFDHLVPEEIRNDPEKIEVFMDGGTVVTEEVMYDRGRAGATTEQVEHELPDRDVSRIESGHNGGEYSTDNTLMEDASVNRARGADNMTPEELDVAQADNAKAVEMLEQGEVISTDTTLVEGIEPSLAEELLGGALEAVVPAVFSAKAAMFIADQCDTVEDKIGFGALGAGTTTLLFVNPVTGPLAWTGAGIYSAYKLAQLGCRVAGKLADA